MRLRRFFQSRASEYIRNELLSDLKKCGDLESGRKLHAVAIKNKDDSNICVVSSLIGMYGKCGSMLEAHAIFDGCSCHDVVSWTVLMLGYADNGCGKLALQVFACMQLEGCRPDSRTFIAAFKACVSLATCEDYDERGGEILKLTSLHKVTMLHSQAAASGFDSGVFVENILIDAYAKCGALLAARCVFNKMTRHDVVSWTTLMMGYADNGEGEVALHLLECMLIERCTPNSRTFVAAIKACISLASKEAGQMVNGKLVRVNSLLKGKAVHREAQRLGCATHIVVGNAMVDMYSKCGDMVSAHLVFEGMMHHDVVSWSSLVLGYAENGESEMALDLFARMLGENCAPNARTFVGALKACIVLAGKEEGNEVDGNLVKTKALQKVISVHTQALKSISNSFVANTLIDAYAKCGSMFDARRVFECMPYHDVVSWTALMSGYVDNGEGGSALQLFARMKSTACAPNLVTYLTVLKASGKMAALEAGKEIHAELCKRGIDEDAALTNCLISFYGRCGSMVDAHRVFDAMTTRELVSWNSLISGYSRLGDIERVLDLFERMRLENVKPNEITLLSLLTAFSHAGMVEKGKEYFLAMDSEYGISPGIEHYRCLIDMLGRANQLNDAVELMKGIKEDVMTWTTILGACCKWKNVELGKLAFESLIRLDSKQAAAYVLMANIYGCAGMWEEQAKVQATRRNARAWKKAGQSCWTDFAGRVHAFRAGDTSHPQSVEIYKMWRQVLVRMKDEGYVADVASVVRDVTDEEKEDVLCGHSEKLAIACALINTSPRTTIRIVKNLRVCDDCHKATAILSKLEKRTIICRDASRFHVFADGKCSCSDFW